MNTDRLHASFLEMVSIESPSFHEAAMAAYCKAHLEALGCSVLLDDSAAVTGSDTGNLIARLPGNGRGSIAFCAHLDTVVPCTDIEVERTVMEIQGEETEVYRSCGSTILSADDKAGITAILEGVRSAIESGEERPDLTIILTTAEEQSLVGASALAEDVLEGDVPCFVLDADGRPGSIIISAPFHHTLRATFKGRAAHAGVEPEEGRSAIQAAASAISTMTLGRIDDTTTANIGIIEGGAAVNIVAERCTIEGECRSLSGEKVRAVCDAITQACERAAELHGAELELDWTCDYPGILFDEADEIVERLKAAALRADLKPTCMVSGGGADANILSTKGACAITLGIGMTNFHSIDEFIRVKDLEDSARFVEAIIHEYAS